MQQILANKFYLRHNGIRLEGVNILKNRIKEVRKEKKITQAELVENMNITRQYISLLEKSEIEPSMKVANGIANALGSFYANYR
jgi:transcriptional regulator, XRE family